MGQHLHSAESEVGRPKMPPVFRVMPGIVSRAADVGYQALALRHWLKCSIYRLSPGARCGQCACPACRPLLLTSLCMKHATKYLLCTWAGPS